MLSRVADRLYWTARYIERAENIARLVNVHASLILDLPKGVGLEWRQLVNIAGSHELFAKRFRSAGERSVLAFMLGDTDNPGSILSCLSAARENMRTTRDRMPSEAWEGVNELYLFARRTFDNKALRKNLHANLSQVVRRCQQITGLLAGTMSHGDGYQFVRLGRNLERADMTTRILDVGSAVLDAPGDEIESLYDRRWSSVLRTLGADQMYRQDVRRAVRGEYVVGYLLKDALFPRSLAHTLGEMRSCLETFPNNDGALRAVAHAQRRVTEADSVALAGAGLHNFIDELQADLGAVHDQVAGTWLTPPITEPAAAAG